MLRRPYPSRARGCSFGAGHTVTRNSRQETPPANDQTGVFIICRRILGGAGRLYRVVFSSGAHFGGCLVQPRGEDDS